MLIEPFLVEIRWMWLGVAGEANGRPFMVSKFVLAFGFQGSPRRPQLLPPPVLPQTMPLGTVLLVPRLRQPVSQASSPPPLASLRTSPDVHHHRSVLSLRPRSLLPTQILIFGMINIAICINNEFVHQKLISTRRLHVIRGPH